MTTGNTSCETLQTTVLGCFPQVTEYCLLNTKATFFLFLEMRWLYDFYYSKDFNEKQLKAFEIIKQLFTLEELIDNCISSKDCDFISELLTPYVEANEVDNEVEVEILKCIESIFLQVQSDISLALEGNIDTIKIKGFNLIGFFGTSAIVSLHDLQTNYYPSFKELYGNALNVDRTKKPVNPLSNHHVLQAFIPIISKSCTTTTVLFDH